MLYIYCDYTVCLFFFSSKKNKEENSNCFVCFDPLITAIYILRFIYFNRGILAGVLIIMYDQFLNFFELISTPPILNFFSINSDIPFISVLLVIFY